MSEFSEDWRLEIDPVETDTDPIQFRCQSPNDGIHISGTVDRAEQGLKISRMEFSADPSGSAEVTGTLMRQVPVGTLLRHIRGRVSVALTQDLLDAHAATEVVPAGRASLTDGFLRNVAISYLRQSAPGQPSGVTRRLAEDYGRPEQTIRTWLAKARKEGWLSPGTKGRAGADPGPRLLARESCATCGGNPPAGYACKACGADS